MPHHPSPLRRPWSVLAVCIVLVGVALFLAMRHFTAQPLPLPPADRTRAFTVDQAPSRRLPARTRAPGAPPAILSVRAVRTDGGPVPTTQLAWLESATETRILSIPAGGVLDATLAPRPYLFHLEAEDALCLDVHNLLLESGKTVSATFHLVPAATLEVAVLANVRPGVPEGARVVRHAVKNEQNGWLREFQPAATVWANENGRVRLDELLPGARYEIVAAATGFLEQRREIVAGEVMATTFYLNAGGAIAGGVLFEATGGPVVGLPLHLWGHGLEPALATTDASGSFVFNGLWPGEYCIEPATTILGALTDGGTAMPIALRLGEHRDDLLLFLGPGSAIRVRLMDGRTGKKVAAARLGGDRPLRQSDRYVPQFLFGVGLMLPDGSTQARVMEEMSDAVFSGLPAGDYVVSLQTPKVPFPEQSRLVSLAAAEEVVVDFIVPASNTISGTVVDPAGNPVEGAKVETSGRRGGGYSAPPTSATGYFCIGHLDRSSCSVVAECTDYAPGYALKVPVGTDDLVLRLSEGGTLQVLVLDDDGKPLPAAEVEYDQMEGLNPIDVVKGMLKTDADGRCTVVHLPEGLFVLKWDRDGHEGERWVEIREGRTTYVVLGGCAVIAGTVRVNGEPAAGWTVVHVRQPVAQTKGILDLEEVASAKTTCDPNGLYRLASGPAGRKGWLAVYADGMDYAHLVEVTFPTEGETRVDIEFNTTTLAGRVVDAGGSSCTGYDVKLVPARKGPAPPCACASVEDLAGIEIFTSGPHANTDERGQFVFQALPPGEYLLASDDQPPFPARKVRCPEAGGRVDVELLVDAAGVLEGRLLRPVDKSVALLARNQEGFLIFDELRDSQAKGGVYRYEGLAAGRYDLAVMTDPDDGVCFFDYVRDVRIESGKTTRHDFHPRPARMAFVRVMDAETGDGLCGFASTVVPRGGGRAEDFGYMPEIMHCVVVVARPGRYEIKIQQPDYHAASVELEVPEIEAVEAPFIYSTVRLQPR